MNQENKNVKFDPNLPTAVELTFDEPKSGDSKYTNEDGTIKKWYLYGIKPLISGESGFFATPMLNEKLQAMGVKTGSNLIITKIVKDDKTAWDIRKLGEDTTKEVSIDDIPEVIEEVKTGMTLEQKVNILWSEYEKKNPKTVSDDLPF
mgnify:CR=1 FL=1